MNSKSVKVQQIVMTLLSIVFLVGVAVYGNKEKKEDKEIAIVEKSPREVEEVKREEHESEEVEEVEEVVETASVSAMVLNSKYHTYTKEYTAKAKVNSTSPVKETIAGKVVSVLVREGQVVTAGQVMYEVEVGSLQLSKKEKDKEQSEYRGLKRDLERAENRLQKLARKDSVAFVKQRDVVEGMRKDLKELNDKINGTGAKYSRQVIKAEQTGIVKGIAIKTGDTLMANENHTLLTIVGYDVFFDVPESDMGQWRQGASGSGQNTLVSSFETKDGQRIPIKFNLMSETNTFSIERSAQIVEGLKINGEGVAENKVIISLVYKDVIEVPYSAISLNSEGKQVVTIVGENEEVQQQKEITPIRKYASYVLISDRSLEGVSVQNKSK